MISRVFWGRWLGYKSTPSLPVAIVERTQTGALSAEEHAKLNAAIDAFALIAAQLQTKDASLERLRRMIFGATTESTRTVLGEMRGEAIDVVCTQHCR